MNWDQMLYVVGNRNEEAYRAEWMPSRYITAEFKMHVNERSYNFPYTNKEGEEYALLQYSEAFSPDGPYIPTDEDKAATDWHIVG